MVNFSTKSVSPHLRNAGNYGLTMFPTAAFIVLLNICVIPIYYILLYKVVLYCNVSVLPVQPESNSGAIVLT